MRSARAVGRRATREAAAGALDVAPEDIVRSLSMPLRRADVDSLLVLCGLGGVELQPRELMLVMERNVFGACVEALKNVRARNARGASRRCRRRGGRTWSHELLV